MKCILAKPNSIKDINKRKRFLVKIKNYKSDFKVVWTYIFTALVAVLLAFNYQLFVVENNFAPAGLNGIATMVQYKTGFSIGYMSLLINVPLCIFAYFFIDKKFAKLSMVFCLTYSFVFLYLQKLGLEFLQYNAEGQDTIFPAILSGVISGYVYGACFRTNSSAGGTQIISKYISKKKPELNFFWVNFVLNAIVAVASLFVYASPNSAGNMSLDYRPVCLCITYCFVSSYISNNIIKGTKVATRFTIVTNHPDEITEEITKIFRHTCTRIEAVGGYSNDDKTMLICIINRQQLVDFKNMLSKYDNTFSFSETVNETYGNFKKIK